MVTGRNSPQFDRIKGVFEAEEIPFVRAHTLRMYFEFLKSNLLLPCILTGMESLGYFRWEERFSLGYGNKLEYERLRKQSGSFRDRYELKSWQGAVVEDDWDIFVNVYRIPYRKHFNIPLSELQVEDKTSKNFQKLNDFSVWRVNWQQFIDI